MKTSQNHTFINTQIEIFNILERMIRWVLKECKFQTPFFQVNPYYQVLSYLMWLRGGHRRQYLIYIKVSMYQPTSIEVLICIYKQVHNNMWLDLGKLVQIIHHGKAQLSPPLNNYT